MRPKKVVEWREQLPPPFDKPSPPVGRRGSAPRLEVPVNLDHEPALLDRTSRRKRRNSAPGAVDQVDRDISWLRFIHAQRAGVRQEESRIALAKLRKLQNARPTSTETILEEPTREQLLALTLECFPPIEESKVIITEYSASAHLTMEYTLEEVLASKYILRDRGLVPRVRWVYVEYYKLGTFWGSGYRFSQWGTDPVLFEKSPIVLLLDHLANLDREAGCPPLEEDDLPGYKRIGRYYRQVPGCPEYLGLRVNPSTWLESEPYRLLLDFLDHRPSLREDLQRSKLHDLEYGLAYINAIRCIREVAYETRPGLRTLHQVAQTEGAYLYGNWDDTVERVEFYRENTLLSCGSPRFYKVVADQLLQQTDVLRQHPDCALLYYTLARVSIENDEMMQDAPERALNKVFVTLQNTRGSGREDVELHFSLQQAVLDGLEYLEENRRELPIWGIPPFENHQVCFHPVYAPSPQIRALIQKEMDLIDNDFNAIIGHWNSLKRKVDRHLDLLLQFRVLDQQELAVSQNRLATRQQALAIDEARSSRAQSRSVFIFTVITIIFVPLSFFTSYFGMNFKDIAGTVRTSTYFWMTAGPISAVILTVIVAAARFFNSVGGPALDEEKAMTNSEAAEIEGLWPPRWGIVKRKLKIS